MENKWTPGWLAQLICFGLGCLWIFGPVRDSAPASSFLAASIVIGVMRTLHKEKS